MPSPTLTGFQHKVVVGIAELAVSNNQNVTLTTYSLGSCLGISIYDPVIKAGGLLHIMLPDSSIDADKAAAHPAMFVDTGVPALFRNAYQLGADKYRMIICVAGGAQIMDNSGYFNIGARNYETLKKLFAEHGLRIHAEQVGGMVNRTMYLNLANGEVRLKVSGQPQETILCKSLTIT
ncbi:MAG TPA: chemotaxis protein CheD [Methylomirabilota bacterium]|nr:chemotaxis protein CheD [Methylomirabilota bacterium]